ncbi:hypothetical protein HaLaN_26487 [Haematococcus lacustris]|uniref:Uncharacterized protein n=1 Tax=Haematococcus lacustris TaxID=44745 RepID=A0A6A0A6Q4_HAELA|nr:hypothetical protein HaLaN_26487 [Haematococcus lacustris]
MQPQSLDLRGTGKPNSTQPPTHTIDRHQCHVSHAEVPCSSSPQLLTVPAAMASPSPGAYPILSEEDITAAGFNWRGYLLRNPGVFQQEGVGEAGVGVGGPNSVTALSSHSC